MRNKNRIKPFLEELGIFWEKNQDLRFGQVIYLLAEELKTDIFFPEEDKWLDAIKSIETPYYKYEELEKTDRDLEKIPCATTERETLDEFLKRLKLGEANG